MKRFLAAMMATLALGCADATESGLDELDGEHDDLPLGGKGDDGETFTETEVLAIVRSANGLAGTIYQPDLGVSARESLLAYLFGPDQKRDTADDRKIHSLEELDAIPWIGPIAIELLRQDGLAHSLPTEQERGRWRIMLETTPPTVFEVEVIPARENFASWAFLPPTQLLSVQEIQESVDFKIRSLTGAPFELAGETVKQVSFYGRFRDGRICGSHGYVEYEQAPYKEVHFVAVRPDSGVPLAYCD